AWLALAALFLLATWAGVLAPELSWDALAYHPPEARDIAASGRGCAPPAVPSPGSARHRDIGPGPTPARPRAPIASLARPRRLSRAGIPFRRRAGGKSGPVPPVRDGPLRLRRRARSCAPAQSRWSVGSDRPGPRGFPDRDAAAPLGVRGLA